MYDSPPDLRSEEADAARIESERRDAEHSASHASGGQCTRWPHCDWLIEWSGGSSYTYSAWLPVGRKHDLQEERRVLRALVKGQAAAPVPYVHKRGAAIIATMRSDKLDALKSEIAELRAMLETRRNVIVRSGEEAQSLDETQECEPIRFERAA